MTSSRKPTSQRRRSGLPLRASWDRARIERTGEGVLTEVYRLRRREETLYLRVAEVAGESMAPETAVRIGRQAPLTKQEHAPGSLSLSRRWHRLDSGARHIHRVRANARTR